MYELPVNCCKQIAVALYGGHLNIKRSTLLAKQNRRLLNEDLRPCTQILKAKYLPKTNIANSNTNLRGICEKKVSVWLIERKILEPHKMARPYVTTYHVARTLLRIQSFLWLPCIVISYLLRH